MQSPNSVNLNGLWSNLELIDKHRCQVQRCTLVQATRLKQSEDEVGHYVTPFLSSR